MNDLFWIKRTFLFTKRASFLNKIPIGCILVYNNFEIASSFNYSDNYFCFFDHAEINVLKQAMFYLSNYILLNTTLYTTLNPCLMCLNSLYLSKVKNYIFNIPCFENLDVSIYKFNNFFRKNGKFISYNLSNFVFRNYFKKLRN